MSRSLHTFTCWLAIAMMALVATVFQSGLVVCASVDGTLQVEWGCSGDGCPQTGPARGPAAETTDCTDSPLESEAPRTPESRNASVPALLGCGPVHRWMPCIAVRKASTTGDASMRLVASKAALRTTILVV